MKKCATDIKLWISIGLAHILLYLTFIDKDVFWYLYGAALLFLISYTILNESIDDHLPAPTYIVYGIISGILIYLIFWIGYEVLSALSSTIKKDVAWLYNRYKPMQFWHFIVLFLVLIPGEEIFWRGFVQKRLSRYFQPALAIIIASFLGASVFWYAGKWALMIAAFVGGLVWGALFEWKRSIPLLIVSHLVVDILIFIVFPFH
ncbi:CPBP family intramembrane glutamic endopeptidase [Aeribacillus pallidus]|uniref:CPBP family intramembrane glutamic endopeptidase n=1 Tax=Aeribacillus pallidus TaxID=33936 RepID=UPI003D25BBEF